VSSAGEVAGKIPSPGDTVATLKAVFAGVGFSTDEMVTLAGAHSVGVAACGTIQNRLADATLASTFDASFAAALRRQCPAGSASKVNLDATTPTRLDEVYYRNLQARRGVLQSDQALQDDSETQPMVAQHTNPFVFTSKFVAAMIKMGNVGVLTGSQGQIRLSCRKFNV
jgi:peroxidase